MDDSNRRNIAFGLEDEDINEKRIRQSVAQAQLANLVTGLPDGQEEHHNPADQVEANTLMWCPNFGFFADWEAAPRADGLQKKRFLAKLGDTVLL